MRIFTNSLLVLLMTGVTSLQALSATPFSLEGMVPISELIVLGVIHESKPGEARITVQETIKGLAPETLLINQIHEWRAPEKKLEIGSLKLFFLNRGEGFYRPVGTNRFLEGIQSPTLVERVKALVAKEPWGAGNEGICISLSTFENRVMQGKSVWLHLQAKNSTGKPYPCSSLPNHMTKDCFLLLESPTGQKTKIQHEVFVPGTADETENATVTTFLSLAPGITLWTLDPNTPLFRLTEVGIWKISWGLSGTFSNMLEIRVLEERVNSK